MKKKPLSIDEFKNRAKISRKRTKDLHSQIGIISSNFTWLEGRLVDMLSRCVNHADPEKAREIISYLSFRQCLNLFRQFIPKWFPNHEVTSQVKDLIKRLDNIAERRNEFIHSFWVNYHPNLVAQNRPRSRSGKASGFEMHDKTIQDKMNVLIEDMDELIFDLDLLICRLNQENCEQRH